MRQRDGIGDKATRATNEMRSVAVPSRDTHHGIVAAGDDGSLMQQKAIGDARE